MINSRARRFASTAGLVLITILLVVALRRLDLSKVAVELRGAHFSWLLGAVACYLVSLPLWALQWHVLAPPGVRNTFRNMLGTVAINATIYCTGVLVAGEASGLALLVTRVGVDRSAALSVITMDQLFVGLTKLILFGAVALTLPLPAWMRRGVTSLGGSVLVLAIVALVLTWKHASITTRMGARLPARVTNALTALGHSLSPLRSWNRATSAFALAIGKKGCEALAIVCVLHAFDIRLPPGGALLALAALNLTTMLPLIPGNLGVFEATLVLIYTQLGVPAEKALGVALVQHICYLASFALPGYGWLVFGSR